MQPNHLAQKPHLAFFQFLDLPYYSPNARRNQLSLKMGLSGVSPNGGKMLIFSEIFGNICMSVFFLKMGEKE